MWAQLDSFLKENPPRINLKGFLEVPGGFEPPSTVLQTGA